MAQEMLGEIDVSSVENQATCGKCAGRHVALPQPDSVFSPSATVGYASRHAAGHATDTVA